MIRAVGIDVSLEPSSICISVPSGCVVREFTAETCPGALGRGFQDASLTLESSRMRVPCVIGTMLDACEQDRP